MADAVEATATGFELGVAFGSVVGGVVEFDDAVDAGLGVDENLVESPFGGVPGPARFGVHDGGEGDLDVDSPIAAAGGVEHMLG